MARTVIQGSDVLLSVSGPGGGIVGGFQSLDATIDERFADYMESGEQISDMLPKPDVVITGRLRRALQDLDQWARIFGGDGSIQMGQEHVPPALTVTCTINSPAKGLNNRRIQFQNVQLTSKGIGVAQGAVGVGEDTAFQARGFIPL
jgi:hypothetical protein